MKLYAFVVVLCTCWLSIAWADDAAALHDIPAPPDKAAHGLSIDFIYARPDFRVGNMPLLLRNIPIHPDDTFVDPANAGPITRTQWTAHDSYAICPMYNWELNKKVRIGIGFDWIISPASSQAERNYTNAVGTDSRGDGAALTYLKFREGGAIPPTGTADLDAAILLCPRIKLEVAPFPSDRFRLGASVSYQTIVAEAGWDRFDDYESWKERVLAHEIPIRIYATWYFDDVENDPSPHLGFTSGVQFQQALIRTNTGREANLHVPPVAFFVSLTLQLY